MMTSLHVNLKNRTLLSFGVTFLSSFILNFLVLLALGDRSLWECITTAALTGFIFTLTFMAITRTFNPMLRHKLNGAFPLREGEKILKWAKVGYILQGKPVQGELTLTDQRLLFQGEKPLYADREEISDVKLSAIDSIYRTGITVSVKDREHIFTVAMPDRWVSDIRNVVVHGDIAN
jgi:hypothetical protein